MGRSVHITTPIPTLDEVGKNLKMSKVRQKRLIEIVTGKEPVQFVVRRRNTSGATDGRSRSGTSTSKLSTTRSVPKVSALSKKSKRAAAG